jgi:hypothetical protein
VPERHWCFSDIKALYDQRGFDVKAVPYANPPADYPVNYVFEYPPGDRLSRVRARAAGQHPAPVLSD